MSEPGNELNARTDWARERVDQHIIGPVSNIAWREVGVDVYGAEWDQLLVLDACRADLFEAVADLSRFDSYERRLSRASATCEWTEQNWHRDAGDVEYISANHVVTENLRSWDDFWDYHGAYINVSTPTMHADDFVTEVEQIGPDVDNHRVVVHAVEPHAPFHAAEWFNLDGHKTPWRAMRNGDRSRGEVWQAYQENLRFALDELLPLVVEWPGRTVITSDHGNLLGERVLGTRIFGHPRGVRHRQLLSVPWAVIEDTAGDATADGKSPTAIDDQMEALGYA